MPSAGRPGFLGKMLRLLVWFGLWLGGRFKGLSLRSYLLGLGFLRIQLHRRLFSRPQDKLFLGPSQPGSAMNLSWPLPHFGSYELMHRPPAGLVPAGGSVPAIGRRHWLARRPALGSILFSASYPDFRLARLGARFLEMDQRWLQRWFGLWEARFLGLFTASVRLQVALHHLALRGGFCSPYRPRLVEFVRALDLYHTVPWRPPRRGRHEAGIVFSRFPGTA